jgi:hypothetical protein
MHTSNSPGRAERRGSSRRHGENQHLNSSSIPERALSSNRQLLERAGNVRLWALTEGRRTHYEVEAGESRWEFNLLWSAISKFDRIVRRKEGARS